MSAQTIYFKLVEAGMSPVGACAMMGNMWAESGGKSTNVEDRMHKILGMTDEEYIAAVDSGRYLKFAGDAYGVGLCQWTLRSRKAGLLNYARSRGVSVGNEDMQVDYAVLELQTEPEYRKLWQYLRTATGIYEAAERICREFERPTVNNVKDRAGYADGFYMQFGGMEGETIPQSPAETAPFTQGSLDAEESYWPPRVLALGMYGPDVVALQGLLIAHGFPAGITGTFDGATASQLMAFQEAKGLKADGIAGDKSWAALTRR